MSETTKGNTDWVLDEKAIAKKDRKFLIKAKATSLAHVIWRLLGLKPPKNVMPAEAVEL